ncbi:conserved lysine-rich protein, putative [Talaromyces stipitatus ATCC 10500]|uniref:Conserved lysine-rich protein, putative n=1 Tax=Talaromyces stipitatus (strain ATCC 10500 / CBS 375.48 / QM 6759 / NRRL 1006) TaxID=441959 RepID=B8LWJ0_TALSN|nr:conserved lysine-rich protein, putative [Talaromyces stipitatus ATCC 10500]EED24301.1 conserved lysine-rich protein, putative [Talaromyces stipitatus ATCC 10500]
MSAAEVAKPVEETAPVTETPAAEPAPAATESVAAPATEVTAAAAEATEAAAAVEAPKEEAKEEVTPATDGTLGYKGPGLVKSFRFTKRFFYFSDDAVEAKNLTSYLASEKSSAAAQRTAAWATQTGKGLLLLTKRAEDKATPAGIFNLSEVSDISKEGSTEFSFKTHGHKHVFQATSAAERDGWVAALTTKSSEAEAEKETVTGSEGYKAELEKITKPAVVAAAVKAAPAPEKDAKETETAAEDKKEEKKDDKKSRSQSRKRTSIFGTILGKKEKEEAKEETPAATETTPAEATPATETAAAETTEAPTAEATTEEAAPATEAAATEAPAEEKKEEAKPAAKPKRASIFGEFFKKVASPSKEKTEEEVAPVASTAPQLENPVDENAAKPIEPEAVTEAPAVEAATASSSETPAAEAATEDKKEATTPENKRRTSLFGTLGKKSKTESTSDGEGKKTNKLGGLFRKPSKAVKSEDDKKKEATPAETIPEGEDKPEPIAKDVPADETAAHAAEKTEEPAVAAEPVNVTPTAAPVQAAA